LESSKTAVPLDSQPITPLSISKYQYLINYKNKPRSIKRGLYNTQDTTQTRIDGYILVFIQSFEETFYLKQTCSSCVQIVTKNDSLEKVNRNKFQIPKRPQKEF